MASAALGLLNGVDDYFFSYGASRLLVSTSALIVSTQLAFTAVYVVTVGAVVLGLHASGDHCNESNKQYFAGFFVTLAKARSVWLHLTNGGTYIQEKANQTIPGEAKEFALGEPYYYVLLSFSAIVWQFFFMGAIGGTRERIQDLSIGRPVKLGLYFVVTAAAAGSQRPHGQLLAAATAIVGRLHELLTVSSLGRSASALLAVASSS
ncbi:hypothetical protein Syun_021542 [Stephania yunnanensis]|uniref:Uncharacterized protein n=1 Tax=Stephania yunnanensis TaxID=152371 RepID=A0AAP0NR65_9MAGN